MQHPLLLNAQNRQTTEVEDLIRKFAVTWPEVKVGTCFAGFFKLRHVDNVFDIVARADPVQ